MGDMFLSWVETLYWKPKIPGLVSASFLERKKKKERKKEKHILTLPTKSTTLNPQPPNQNNIDITAT